MEHALRILAISVTLAVGVARAESPLAVPVDGKPFAAKLVGVDGDWELTFEDGGKRTMAAAELVRWGTCPETKNGPIVLLADGGVLAGDVFAGDKETISVDSGLFGAVKLPLNKLAGVVFYPPADKLERDRLTDQVVEASGNSDRIILQNGDRLAGLIEGIADQAVKLRAKAGPMSIATHRIAGLVFDPALRQPTPRAGLRCWVGFADGSRLLAERLVLTEKSLSLSTAGQTLKTFPEDIVWLQPIGGRTVYLSDQKATGYRHVPFLDLKWPYKKDRNATGGRLRSGGKLYAKGVGMHSAARLTYLLDRPYKRFDAELAIDDGTSGGGSVRFRVYVDGKPKYGSEIIRGGDSPVPISVDVSDAKRLDIIVDFADRADQLDYADWLDARLVK